MSKTAENTVQIRGNDNLSDLTRYLLSDIGLPVVCTVLPLKFTTRIDFRASGCWEWKGSRRASRCKRYVYPLYCYSYAHVMSYEAHNGPVPNGLEVDHLCHNKLCVNPEHLEAVTHKVNCQRRRNSGPRGWSWVVIDGQRRFIRVEEK